MTEETLKTVDDIADPAERAVANGYKEAPPPSREERVKAAIEAIDHARNHNAQLDRLMVEDIKALLSGD